jgi:para-aminobenzoate synthetase component 1
MLSKQEAIVKMNDFGKEKRPFFFMIDFLQANCLVLPLEELESDKIQFSMPTIQLENTLFSATKETVISHEGYSQGLYFSKIQKVIQNIKQGNSFLVNLTCQTPIELNTDLETVYFQTEAKYKLWVKDSFVVFSPETFVSIQKGEIASYPMKGTIDADLPNARELILNSPKEKAEHYTIVDLIRNDLSMVADGVEVSKFRYIDELQTDRGRLLQVSSEIKGHLPLDWQAKLGETMFTLLPAGSISGAPKPKTVAIIRDAENYERGFYTGVFGVFDGESLDSAVMIRFIEQTPEGYVYKSGGGITVFSKLEDEYNEMLKKIYVPISRKY